MSRCAASRLFICVFPSEQEDCITSSFSRQLREPEQPQPQLPCLPGRTRTKLTAASYTGRFKFVNGHIFCKDCKCAVHLPPCASGKKSRIVRGPENHLRNDPHLQTMVNLLMDQRDARFNDFLCHHLESTMLAVKPATGWAQLQQTRTSTVAAPGFDRGFC